MLGFRRLLLSPGLRLLLMLVVPLVLCLSLLLFLRIRAVNLLCLWHLTIAVVGGGHTGNDRRGWSLPTRGKACFVINAYYPARAQSSAALVYEHL